MPRGSAGAIRDFAADPGQSQVTLDQQAGGAHQQRNGNYRRGTPVVHTPTQGPRVRQRARKRASVQDKRPRASCRNPIVITPSSFKLLVMEDCEAHRQLYEKYDDTSGADLSMSEKLLRGLLLSMPNVQDMHTIIHRLCGQHCSAGSRHRLQSLAGRGLRGIRIGALGPEPVTRRTPPVRMDSRHNLFMNKTR